RDGGYLRARCAAGCAVHATTNGRRGMRIVYLTHSLRSCWNHGNAHFLRGVLSALMALGHDVQAYEPKGAWSLANLLKDHGPGALESFRRHYPELRTAEYEASTDVAELVDGADLVVVHEW